MRCSRGNGLHVYLLVQASCIPAKSDLRLNLCWLPMVGRREKNFRGLAIASLQVFRKKLKCFTMELISLPESIKIIRVDSQPPKIFKKKIEVVLNLPPHNFFTPIKNLKLDMLIRIRFKNRLQESFLSYKPINLKLRVAQMGYFFAI